MLRITPTLLSLYSQLSILMEEVVIGILHYKVVWTASTALGEILQCETAGAKDPHTQYAHFRVVGFFCFGLALL